MVIGVDFDGTITEDVGYHIQGPIREDFMLYAPLIAKKHKLVLNTARKGIPLLKAIYTIRRNKLPVKFIGFGKPKADIYIDDKNIFCKRIDWKEIYEYLNTYDI